MRGCLVLVTAALAVTVILGSATTAAVAVFQDAARNWTVEQTRHATEMHRIAEQRAEVELQQAAERAERDAAFWRSVDGILRLALQLITLAGAALALAAAAFLGARFLLNARFRRDFVIVAGIPVSYQLAQQGATLPMAMTAVIGDAEAKVETAKRPVLPSDLRTYNHAPRLAAPTPARTLPQPPAAPTLPAPASPIALPAPDWQHITTAGLLTSPAGWLLGFDGRGQPVRSPGWDTWIHAAIAGLSRSGKSNTARLMLAQAAQRGMRLVILDPHALHPDGVGHGLDDWPALLAPVATTSDAMLDAAAQIQGWLQGSGAGHETLIVIDEWTRLLDGGVTPTARDAITQAARGLVTSGAKFGLHLCVIGQGWTVEAASHVRDQLQMAYLHKLRLDQAKLVTNSRPPASVESLPRGQAHAWFEGDWQRINLPLITAADMRSVATLPSTVARPRSDDKSWGGADTGADTSDTGAHQVQDEDTALRDRIRALDALGYSRNRICDEIWGSKNEDRMDLLRAVLGPAK